MLVIGSNPMDPGISFRFLRGVHAQCTGMYACIAYILTVYIASLNIVFCSVLGYMGLSLADLQNRWKFILQSF